MTGFYSKGNTDKIVVCSTTSSIDDSVYYDQTRYFNEQIIKNSMLLSDYRYNEFGEILNF